MPGEPRGGGASRIARFAPKLLRAAAGSAYLFSVGWRHPRHRALITTIATHFGHRADGVGRIPRRSLMEVAPDDVEVRLCEPEGADGNVSLLELLVICRLVRASGATRLLEIGTFDGRTTLNLAANSPEDAHVYTLDLPREDVDRTRLPLADGERVFVEKSVSGERYRRSPYRDKVTQLFGDSAAFDFGPYRDSMDFVFVDGSHAYDYVTRDSETALGLVRPEGGIVVWHDFGVWDGVTRALDHLAGADTRFAGLIAVAGTTLAVLDTRSAGGVAR